MSIKPPAPFNSITGLVWLAILVVAIIVGVRKVAPVQKYVKL